MKLECFNCTNEWKIEDDYIAVGPFKYIRKRLTTGSLKGDYHDETIAEFNGSSVRATPIRCPECGMQGPHDIQ